MFNAILAGRWYKVLTACLAIIGLFPFAAGAQDCSSLIAHGLRNIEVEKSTSAAIATKYYRNCGVKFADLSDSILANLEVEVFGYGSGAGSFSRAQREQRLEQWCITNSEYAKSAKGEYFESQSIMAEALVAWDHCNQLAAKGVHTEPRISGDRRIVELAVSNTSPTPIPFYGIAVTNFSCDIQVPNIPQPKVKATFAAGEPVSLGPAAINIHCERKVVQKTIADQQYSWLEAATISVRTASEPYQLYFPEETDPALPDRLAQKLETELALAQKMLLPIGGIVGFALKPEAVAALAPYWLPADGRTVNDALSPLNGMKLPDLRGRGLRGLDPARDASDDSQSTGGTLTLNIPISLAGTTSELILSRCTERKPEPRLDFPGQHSAVWDTGIDEQACQHTHQLGNATLKGELPPPPYRDVIFLVRVR